jgi:protein O-GlcNAc transferase
VHFGSYVFLLLGKIDYEHVRIFPMLFVSEEYSFGSHISFVFQMCPYWHKNAPGLKAHMFLVAVAAAQGVRPEQIIFTDVAAKNEHIRRSALADLFLDTPLCNAHTTGTDVLWAGLPMVTLPLEKMATRVAMSLCHAAGCGDEMVVSSMQEYEERAVMLATHPTMLRTLTSKLRSARLSCPLFDTTRWVQNLERAYFKMWNLYCSGSHPQPFKVREDNVEFPFDQ